MLRAAVRLPVPDGRNLILIVQLAPGATDTPQVVVLVKSAALAPKMEIELIDNAVLPLFVNVTVFVELVVAIAWEANVMLVGVRATRVTSWLRELPVFGLKLPSP